MEIVLCWIRRSRVRIVEWREQNECRSTLARSCTYVPGAESRCGQNREIAAYFAHSVLCHVRRLKLSERLRCDVRFWHKADMALAPIDVCFRGSSGHCGMSALPPKVDMVQRSCDVRFVPKADIRQ